MNRWRELVLGAALCGVLVTLAVLQYRWIGQVSEAERTSLERDLRISVNRFTDDFDGEMTRLAQFLVGADNLEARVERWRDTTRFPGLVTKAYAFDSPDLPPYLQNLAARARASANGFAGPPIIVDGGLPAFALPAQRPRNGEISSRWLIVVLDRDYIRETWIPALVERVFGAGFRVEVDANGETIYRLGDGAVPLEDGGWAPLFDLRAGGRGGRGGGPPKGRVKNGPAPAKAFGPAKAFDRDGVDFDKGKAGRPPQPTGWTIRAALKSGTVEETVAGIRARNLAVSFGMLLLMGASVAMLLVSSRRARELAQRQMEFVAGVTHELRTPLAVISSASQNLADGVASTPEQTRRYGGVIRDQGKRLADMVEQILRFAGLSSGQVEIRKQAVDVNELVDKAIADCQPDAAASGSILTSEVAPGVPPVNGDPASLVHALRNLLSNAMKHGEGAPVRLRAVSSGGKVDLTVEDDGPGIDAADLPHLFEPFYRGRRATSEQIQGAGLGLSLVKKIADAHGGTVEVLSKPGHGARFTLHLPAAEVEGGSAGRA